MRLGLRCLCVLAICLCALRWLAWRRRKLSRARRRERHDGVPRGQVTKLNWVSQIFPETTREYYVYVPAQYDGARGGGDGVSGRPYLRERRWRLSCPDRVRQPDPQGDAGDDRHFINPGLGDPPEGRPWRANNRSFEYDTLSDQYARFLLEEILPEVGKDTN